MAKEKHKFTLKTPLCVIDLETSGLSPTENEIIQFAGTRFEIDGTIKRLKFLAKPSCPIPAQASAVHKIYDADVANEQPISHYINELATFLNGCIIGGFNIVKFDIPFLKETFSREGEAGVLDNVKTIDSYVLFCRHSGRKLKDAVMHYCGEEAIAAHTADGDVESTIKVLEAQLKVEGKTVDEIVNQPEPEKNAFQHIVYINEEPYLNFSKYKGTALKDAPKSFISWLLQRDFPASVKEVVGKYA